MPVASDPISNKNTIQQASSKHGEDSSAAAAAAVGPELPPAIAEVKNTTTEEFLKAMNKMPIFMTELDETGADGEENMELEALKALAYEGEPHEVAQNFREQGNECFKSKQYQDAIQFYTKALSVPPPIPTAITTACYTNRAACNLELHNYRRVLTDCTAALKLNPTLPKAWYRSTRACLALEKFADAQECITHGLTHDPNNKPLHSLKTTLQNRRTKFEKAQRARRDRETLKRKEASTLKLALEVRKIATEKTPTPPELASYCVHLENPLDAASTLCFPTTLLYPLAAQSDFIAAFSEHSTLSEQLEMVLSSEPEWDREKEYSPPEKVEAYMETVTGGLVKVGKNVSLLEVLSGGKVVVVDEVLRIMMVPKKRKGEFVEMWKKRKMGGS